METLAITTSQTAQPRLFMNHATQSCPHCNVSLVAGEIPQEHRHNYLPMVKDPASGRYVDGPDDGRFLFYSRLIGISSLWHDRILAFKCPDCQTIDVIPGLEDLWADYLRLCEREGISSPITKALDAGAR